MEKKSISSGTFNEKPPKQFQFLIFFPTLFFFFKKTWEEKKCVKEWSSWGKEEKRNGHMWCTACGHVGYSYRHRTKHIHIYIHSYIRTYTRLVVWAAGCALAVPALCCFVPLSLLLPCCVHCSPTLPRRFDVFSSALPSPPAQASQHMNLISIQNIYHTIAYYYHLWHCLVHAPSCTASVSLTL